MTSIKKLIALILYKLFNLLLNIEIIKNLLTSEKFYFLIQSIIKILGNFSNSKLFQIQTKLKKILDNEKIFFNYNEKLFFHYVQSKKSREYFELLTRKNK